MARNKRDEMLRTQPESASGAARVLLVSFLLIAAGASACSDSGGSGSDNPGSEPSGTDPGPGTPSLPPRPTSPPSTPPATMVPPTPTPDPKPMTSPPVTEPSAMPMPSEPTTMPGTPGTGTGIAVAGPDGIIDLSTSECFNRPAEKIRVVQHGTYDAPHLIKGAIGETWDFRGTFTKSNPSKHPVLFDDPHDVCVVGVTTQGQQRRSLTWDQMKGDGGLGGVQNVFDGDGVSWNNSTGKFIIEGAWIDNMEDGIGPPFDYVPDRSTSYSIRHTYMRYIRDDTIENDGCLTGEMIDTFVDGTHMFHSSRPTKGTPTPGTYKLTVKDSIIKMDCKPDNRADKSGSCPNGTSVGTIYKNGCSGSVHFENVIIMIEGIRGGGWVGGTYKNVTLVEKPGQWIGGGVPSGVTVSRDLSIYEKASADWFKRHGCDSKGDNCSFLHHDKMKVPGPVSPKPFLRVFMNPTFMHIGAPGFLNWYGHDVSTCTATGPQVKGAGSTSMQRVDGLSGAYTFTVTCKGNDGSTLTASDRAYWLGVTNDSTKPEAPGGLTATAAEGSITLKWDEAKDNTLVASYRIYRNGEWISSESGGLSWSDSNVTPDQMYTYEVAGFDVWGNVGEKSIQASVKAQ